MTDKEKLDAIRAEIHRLVDVRGYDREMVNDLFAFMDSLPNEPKDKCQGCNNVKGCITCVDGSEWAHIEESESDIKAYHDRWGKSNGYIEEPVSGNIDFEQELYKAFGQVKDFTLGMQIAKRFYDMGKNSQEPVSEDLEEAADKALDTFDVAEMMCGSYEGWQMIEMFKAGANWQKEHLWKSADGNDLPEYEREVVVFTQNYPDDAGMMMVAIGHRPIPEGYDGKSLTTGEVEHYTPETYGEGGWNIPDVKYWLDVELPKEIEL